LRSSSCGGVIVTLLEETFVVASQEASWVGSLVLGGRILEEEIILVVILKRLCPLRLQLLGLCTPMADVCRSLLRGTEFVAL
jgi:hypothetical protein